jgi:hypothetical protein
LIGAVSDIPVLVSIFSVLTAIIPDFIQFNLEKCVKYFQVIFTARNVSN